METCLSAGLLFCLFIIMIMQKYGHSSGKIWRRVDLRQGPIRKILMVIRICIRMIWCHIRFLMFVLNGKIIHRTNLWVGWWIARIANYVTFCTGHLNKMVAVRLIELYEKEVPGGKFLHNIPVKVLVQVSWFAIQLIATAKVCLPLFLCISYLEKNYTK